VSLPKTFGESLHYPLLTLSGGVLTPGSILAAATILAVSWLLAGASDRWVRRLLARRGLHAGALFAVSKIARYGVVSLGALVAVNSMGLRLDALIAASTVLAVGIGFGLQNIAQNFISGLILLIEQPVRKGDFVKVGGALGVIDDIGLRATHVVTRDEVTIIVPNSSLISGEVVNHSRPTTNLRVHIIVGVAYGTDLKRARQVLLDVARDTPNILVEPPAEVRLERFAESSLDLNLLIWIANPKDDLRIASDVRFAIEEAFAREKIEIPMPQRDVHIRSDAR